MLLENDAINKLNEIFKIHVPIEESSPMYCVVWFEAKHALNDIDNDDLNSIELDGNELTETDTDFLIKISKHLNRLSNVKTNNIDKYKEASNKLINLIDHEEFSKYEK